VTERLLYTLWDAGLQVGHATRTIKESIALSASDMKVKTALLDARYLCGHYELYQEFDKAVENRLVKKRVSRFVQEKLTESRQRHESYGGSVYLLEPDVKDGEGGLRDIHTARWIGLVKAGAKDLDGWPPRNRQSRRCRQTQVSQDFCCGCATSCIFRPANTRTS
jgi:[protein-PII] uridylyltransferase